MYINSAIKYCGCVVVSMIIIINLYGIDNRKCNERHVYHKCMCTDTCMRTIPVLLAIWHVTPVTMNSTGLLAGA